jgi:O-antigen/teichoic acid export membrane protein
MKQKLKEIIKHPLISGSAIIFSGSIIGNVFHFFFNLLMSRNLTVPDYGVIVSLMSLSTLPALAFNSLVPITVNFATGYLANNELDKVKGLYIKITKLMVCSGVFLVLLLTVFSGVIAEFIHLNGNEFYVMLVGFIIFFGLMVLVNVSFLQAKLAFHYVSLITFLGGFLKFLSAVGLILFGYGVGGVLYGLIIGGVISYLVGLLPLRFIFYKSLKHVKVSIREVFGYAYPATIALSCMTSFITTDILLVKHFFSPSDAGLYAGLALIGKVVYYFSAPIGMVMFPLAVKKYAKQESHHRLLFASLLLVLIPSLALTAFYFAAPEFTITFFLKNKEYLMVADKVGLFGIYMTLYSILSILVNFYLSIKRTKVYIPVFLAALIQLVLIVIFHESLLQVVIISAAVTFLLVLGLLLYYPHAAKKRL